MSRRTKSELIVLMSLAGELLRVNCVEAALRALWNSVQYLCPDDLLLVAHCSSGECCFRHNARGASAHVSQKTRRLVDALSVPEWSRDTPGSQVVELEKGALVAAAFANEDMHGRIVLSWKNSAAYVHQAALLLPSLADLVGARLESLVKQGRREQQLWNCELENVEARALAAVDQLTGLQNRRGFIAKAEHCLLIAQRQALACAVIFADVDGLKGVNDRLGHASGDALICCAGSIIKGALRHADVVARVGGDEFAAFTFDNATPATIIDRINRKIEEFNVSAQHPFTLSLSIGVVICDAGSSQSLADYLELADCEMYCRKREQRVRHPGVPN